MAQRIQFRRGTAAAWAAANPVLAAAEMGRELDTGRSKVGDGVSAWSILPYEGGSGSGGSASPDATAAVKGVVRLSGDLAGTATTPLLATATSASLRTRSTHTGTQPSSTISDFAAAVQTTRLDQMAAPTAPVAAGGQRITGLGAPVLSTDAARLADANAATARGTHTGTQTAATISDFDEQVRDVIGAALVAGTGMTVTVNDGADIITLSSTATGGGGGGGGTTWEVLVQVTADGTTNAAPTIQAVLTGLASSHSRSFEVVVEPAYPYTGGGRIFLNSQVRISTSNTRVRFRAPVVIGTGIDPDGFGGLSILGVQSGTTTVSAGAVRGKSVVTVASTSGISLGQLVRIYDNDISGNASAGNKSEMAEVVDITGTNLYLDHPLHHDFTGTVTLAYLTPVTNSGFEDIHATFTGQQAAAFLFPAKAQWTRYCYYRNVHFKGSAGNSWSREGLNFRESYRFRVENCTMSYPWNYGVGSTYCYGFTSDGCTNGTYTACHASNVRHGFTADKGSAGITYSQCRSENVLASGFDLHGGWTRDIVYVACVATSAPDTHSANDGFRAGFLAGNTTFINGCHGITYIGCVSRGFQPYTTNTAGSGDGAGFGVVDGCTNVTFQDCKIYDSEMGIYILSQIGTPITNTIIKGCEFYNISSSDPTSRPAVPIWVNAGAAPEDVVGLLIEGCTFTNSPTQASVRVWGNSGNTLADITIKNNTWLRSQGTTGVYPIDVRYATDLLIEGNVLSKTRRGVSILGCPSALIVKNVFANLTETNQVILDSGGGNTGFLFSDNVVTPAPTALGTAVTSTGAYVDITSPKGVATANLPTLPAGSAGVTAWDTTTGSPAFWSGTAWKHATVT